MTAQPKLRIVDETADDPTIEGEGEGEGKSSTSEPSASASLAVSDEQLVLAAKAKHTRAWATLYERYYPRVHRYLCYLVRDRGAAEDLAQETFARAVQSIRRFRGDSSFGTWIDRIALNVAREHWRKAKTRRNVLERLAEVRPPDDALPAPQYEALQSRVLYAAIDRLPETLREAFILRDVLGLDTPEVAARLGISASNAAVRAHRARKRIEKRLRSQGWMEGLE